MRRASRLTSAAERHHPLLCSRTVRQQIAKEGGQGCEMASSSRAVSLLGRIRQAVRRDGFFNTLIMRSQNNIFGCASGAAPLCGATCPQRGRASVDGGTARPCSGGVLKGKDQFGNEYYEKTEGTAQRRCDAWLIGPRCFSPDRVSERYVVFKKQFDFDASQIPSEWHGGMNRI